MDREEPGGASHADAARRRPSRRRTHIRPGRKCMALDPITLGRRLREARENRRLTQEQAAQAIGISRTALVHIEAGKRSLSTLELSELAKLYHRSVADFFAEDESRARPRGGPAPHHPPTPARTHQRPRGQPSGLPLRRALLHRRRAGDHARHPGSHQSAGLRTSAPDPAVRGDSPG